jgi:sulfite reductase (NADPH) flavoprotein alpha-component
MIISEVKKEINRLNPLLSTIKERNLLSKPGSTKKTYHISLNLQNQPLAFEVGDAIGIYPQNDPKKIESILVALNVTGEELIINPREQKQECFADYLKTKVNLSQITSSLIKAICKEDPSSPLAPLLVEENKPTLLQFLKEHHLSVHLSSLLSKPLALQTFCECLSPLLPRFYSVASSPKINNNTIDLLVALTEYELGGEVHYGVASHFLCHLATHETAIPIYVQKNPHFSLPKDPTLPIIMIGPGTGIAPFRGFIQERLLEENSGKNWLFFGERNRHCDFYYEELWSELVSQNKLKLNLAFSRDGKERRYVQDEMFDSAKELWNTIQAGAMIYICGDAEKMAKGVTNTLEQICAQEGSFSEEEAKVYIKDLRKQKRLLLDVY